MQYEWWLTDCACLLLAWLNDPLSAPTLANRHIQTLRRRTTSNACFCYAYMIQLIGKLFIINNHSELVQRFRISRFQTVWSAGKTRVRVPDSEDIIQFFFWLFLASVVVIWLTCGAEWACTEVPVRRRRGERRSSMSFSLSGKRISLLFCSYHSTHSSSMMKLHPIHRSS